MSPVDDKVLTKFKTLLAEVKGDGDYESKLESISSKIKLGFEELTIEKLSKSDLLSTYQCLDDVSCGLIEAHNRINTMQNKVESALKVLRKIEPYLANNHDRSPGLLDDEEVPDGKGN